MTTISKDCVRRLLRDIKNTMNGSLESHGIYYIHDDADMLTGYALIIGQPNTPYFGGYYFFKFTFTSNYPYVPPIVTFETNYNNYRFHPNLYSNGRICLSILNTWTGDQWSSCQTISTILLTLCMILDNTPLLHEPNIYQPYAGIDEYTRIIEYINIHGSIIKIIRKQIHEPFFDLFRTQILDHFVKNFDDIHKIIKSKLNDDNRIRERFYQTYIIADYAHLVEELELIKTEVTLELSSKAV